VRPSILLTALQMDVRSACDALERGRRHLARLPADVADRLEFGGVEFDYLTREANSSLRAMADRVGEVAREVEAAEVPHPAAVEFLSAKPGEGEPHLPQLEHVVERAGLQLRCIHNHPPGACEACGGGA
jgi:hypothetical protein